MSRVEQKSTEILLSIYRPHSVWLTQLLKSIESQTIPCNRILVRFDDSCPTPLESSYNFEVVTLDDSTHLGPTRSFFHLLEASTGDFALFSDQDDIWLNTKIELLLESISSQDSPTLSFCDYETIDESGSPLKYRRLIPSKLSKFSFLFSNSVPGNCIMINRPLIDLINRSIQVVGCPAWYDWWCVSLARELGVVIRVHKTGMFYRIHNANVIGVRRGKKRIPSLTKPINNSEPVWLQQIRMLVYFFEVSNIQNENLEFLRGIISHYSRNRLERLKFLLSNGIWKSDAIDILKAFSYFVFPRKT